MNKRVLVLIGTPGSGKSTYTQSLKHRYESHLGKDYPFHIVNPDSIRQELFGDASNQGRNDLVWSVAHSRIQYHLRMGGSRQTIVVDALGSMANYRQDLVKLCQKFGANTIVAVRFTTPLEECLMRNSKRVKPVPSHVIVREFENIRNFPPSTREGFSEVRLLSCGDYRIAAVN